MQELIDAYPGFEGVKSEDMEILLPALGTLASRPNMSPSKANDEKLRRIAVDALFEGLRNDIVVVAESLERISHLPQIPKSLSSEITNRLRSKGIVSN